MGGVARGILRIYLGAAPGVGKTYAVLGEAHRRLSRGTDVVVGLIETHGRAHTTEQLDGLEVLPRAEVTHRGVTLRELDVDGVLARRPEVVVIDELAHTNAPGSPRATRWEDVEQVRDADISVRTTLDVQDLESLSDVVEQITGVRPHEAVPDAVVRRADQIELVDMSRERRAVGWPTATSIRPRRWTQPWGTTSGSATSPRCADSPCSGWPTRSTRVRGGTGPGT